MSGTNPAKDRGTKIETKVRDYLRVALDQPDIDRQPQRGVRDCGDLAGLVAHGFSAIVEVKAHRTVTRKDVAEFRRQTLAERENAGADAGVLVVWRYNHPAADAAAHVTLRDLTRLAPALSVDCGWGAWADSCWVQMTLEELCLLIND